MSKKIYEITDDAGREMTAELHDGCLKVTMTFYPDDTLTMEEVCESMGWQVRQVQEYNKPSVLPFKRKE